VNPEKFIKGEPNLVMSVVVHIVIQGIHYMNCVIVIQNSLLQTSHRVTNAYDVVPQ